MGARYDPHVPAEAPVCLSPAFRHPKQYPWVELHWWKYSDEIRRRSEVSGEQRVVANMSRAAVQPDDVVDGTDPTIASHYERVQAFRAVCDCGWSVVDAIQTQVDDRMVEHRKWAHPAYRNPDIACQASPPWDHERWCVRPKGHDGDHWTPSFNGGVGWAPNGRTEP